MDTVPGGEVEQADARRHADAHLRGAATAASRGLVIGVAFAVACVALACGTDGRGALQRGVASPADAAAAVASTVVPSTTVPTTEAPLRTFVVAANGDWSGIDDPARIAEVEAGIQSYSVIAVGDVFGFSWSPCHACGTRLGGDRFEAFVIG